MEKEMFVLRGLPDENYQLFRTRILERAKEAAARFSPPVLRVTLTIRKPPPLSVIPFRRDLIAVVSVYDGSSSLRDYLCGSGGYTGAFKVNEALPVAYQRLWEVGSETPGACLLTLFHSKPGLDRDVFLSRWHHSHTPLSLKIHPLWNYNRNVVVGETAGGTESYHGIVEEQFNPASDLINPIRFFGPLFRVPRHMWMVWKDSRSFIDMKRIETYLASEYHIRA